MTPSRLGQAMHAEPLGAPGTTAAMTLLTLITAALLAARVGLG